MMDMSCINKTVAAKYSVAPIASEFYKLGYDMLENLTDCKLDLKLPSDEYWR